MLSHIVWGFFFKSHVFYKKNRRLQSDLSSLSPVTNAEMKLKPRNDFFNFFFLRKVQSFIASLFNTSVGVMENYTSSSEI